MSKNNVVTTLTIGEIYLLESEINGQVDQQTGQKVTKGVLGHPLSMVHRYWLTDLSDTIAAYKKTVDKLREELITKLGEADDKGGYTLPMTVPVLDENGEPFLDENKKEKREVNPKFIEFNDEMNKLFAETKEIEPSPFTIAVFDFKTDETYTVLFKLLKTKKEEKPTATVE